MPLQYLIMNGKKLVLVPPPIKSTSQAAPSSDSSLDKSKFTTIDGVEYVNNEYLEDQEFNLEGKSGFTLCLMVWGALNQ